MHLSYLRISSVCLVHFFLVFPASTNSIQHLQSRSNVLDHSAIIRSFEKIFCTLEEQSLFHLSIHHWIKEDAIQIYSICHWNILKHICWDGMYVKFGVTRTSWILLIFVSRMWGCGLIQMVFAKDLKIDCPHAEKGVLEIIEGCMEVAWMKVGKDLENWTGGMVYTTGLQTCCDTFDTTLWSEKSWDRQPDYLLQIIIW